LVCKITAFSIERIFTKLRKKLPFGERFMLVKAQPFQIMALGGFFPFEDFSDLALTAIYRTGPFNCSE